MLAYSDPMTTLHPLAPASLPAAADLLAAAFDADPFFVYLQPDPARRREWLRRFKLAEGHMLAPSGACQTLATGEGVLVLTPPGAYPPPPLRAAVFALRVLWASLVTRLSLKRGLRALRVLAEMERRHPSEPHWYLVDIAVAPGAKGRGLGGALMREAIAEAERTGHPLYLETTNAANLPFYAKFGFTQVGLIAPTLTPPVWLLQRSAQ